MDTPLKLSLRESDMTFRRFIRATSWLSGQIGFLVCAVQSMVLFFLMASTFAQASQQTEGLSGQHVVLDWSSSVRQSSAALATFRKESSALLTSVRQSLVYPETRVWEDADQRLFMVRLLQAHRDERFRDIAGLFGYSTDRLSRLRADRRQVAFVALASAHFRLGHHRTAARFCGLVDPQIHQRALESGKADPSADHQTGLSPLPRICARAALVSAIQLGKRIDPWKDYGSFLYVYLRNPAGGDNLPKAFVSALWTLRESEALALPRLDSFQDSVQEDPVALALFALSAAHSGRPEWALEHLERARSQLLPLLSQNASKVTYVFALVEWLTGRVLADMGRREDAGASLERSSEAMLEIIEEEIAAPLPRRRVLLVFGRLIFETAREIEEAGDQSRSLSMLVQLRDAIGLFPTQSADGQVFSEHLQMELDLATVRLQMILADRLTPAGLRQLREKVVGLWRDAASDEERLGSLRKTLARADMEPAVDVLQVFRGIEKIAVKYGDFSSLQRDASRAVARLRQIESAFGASEVMARHNLRGFSMLPPESHLLSLLVEDGRRLIGHHLQNLAGFAAAGEQILRKDGSASRFTVQAWGELLKGELLRFVRFKGEEQFVWGNVRPAEALMRVEHLLSQRAAIFAPDDADTTRVLQEEADTLWKALDRHQRWNSVYKRSLLAAVHLHRSADFLLRLLREQQDLMTKGRHPEMLRESFRLVGLGSDHLLDGLSALREMLRFFRSDEVLRNEQEEQLSRALNTAQVDREKAHESLQRLVLDDASGVIESARGAILKRRAQARLYLIQAVTRGVITSAQAEKELGEQFLRLKDLSDAMNQSAARGGLN